MKRFSTATVATIAAFTLSTTSAHAFDDMRELSSANVDEQDDDLSSAVGESSVEPQNEHDYSLPHWNSNAAVLSSFTDGETEAEPSESSTDAWDGIFGSSYENDENRDWAPGFTADVLVAGLIAFGIAAFNGFIPGVEVPSIPSF